MPTRTGEEHGPQRPSEAHVHLSMGERRVGDGGNLAGGFDRGEGRRTDKAWDPARPGGAVGFTRAASSASPASPSGGAAPRQGRRSSGKPCLCWRGRGQRGRPGFELGL